jgi:transketolase
LIAAASQMTDIRDAFFGQFLDRAEEAEDFVILSADMDAFVLREIAKRFPEKHINIGVSEQNMINVAAGLALTGKKVICYSIASFATLRCFEQIKVNICSMNLPVTIVGAGPGFSFGHDGPTHHGQMDLSAMRLLPEMSVFEISSNDMAARVADAAIFEDTPKYIRLDKGPFPTFDITDNDFERGFRYLHPKAKINIVTSGYMAARALKVAEQLHNEGLSVGVVDVFRVKPIDKAFSSDVLAGSALIVSIEENCRTGGLGSAVADIICETPNTAPELHKIAVPDRQFIEYGDRDWFHEKYGLDESSIKAKVLKLASS